MEHIFLDYKNTNRVYHILALKDLDKALRYGISYDDKLTHKTKYGGFHDFINEHKTSNVPPWVDRRRAIFASLNFPTTHYFHSHSAILSLKINEDRCWVANENLANTLYEPLALRDTIGFEYCSQYLKTSGARIAREYWESSLSFNENIALRKDKEVGFDAEVLISHFVPSEDIQVIYICSDHNRVSVGEFKKTLYS